MTRWIPRLLATLAALALALPAPAVAGGLRFCPSSGRVGLTDPCVSARCCTAPATPVAPAARSCCGNPAATPAPAPEPGHGSADVPGGDHCCMTLPLGTGTPVRAADDGAALVAAPSPVTTVVATLLPRPTSLRPLPVRIARPPSEPPLPLRI